MDERRRRRNRNDSGRKNFLTQNGMQVAFAVKKNWRAKNGLFLDQALIPGGHFHYPAASFSSPARHWPDPS